MDDMGTLKFLENKEVLSHYDRTLLDLVWLQKMMEQCQPKSAAHDHYKARLGKEKVRLGMLEKEMEKRDLFQ